MQKTNVTETKKQWKFVYRRGMARHLSITDVGKENICQPWLPSVQNQFLHVLCNKKMRMGRGKEDNEQERVKS